MRKDLSSLAEDPTGRSELTPAMVKQALSIGSPPRAILARAQAYLFGAAGILGFVGVLLPHPVEFNELGLIALQAWCLLTAGLLLAFAERVPGWALELGPFAGATVNSLAVVFTGSSSSAYAVFYVWVGIYAFYFLGRRAAALLVLFAVANYALALAILGLETRPAGGGAGETIHQFVLVAGTLTVAGFFLVALRERVQRLIGQLTDAARTDPLTGLLNRRGFHRLMEVELERSKRTNRAFSLLVGDCDFFKLVNDRFGHQVGDRTLQRVAALLQASKRRIDAVARIGGEEFALILPETDQHEAYMLSERLRSRFAEEFASDAVPLTMSFGVAAFPAHGESLDRLLRAADEALYAAKALGRDRTVLYSNEVAGILVDAAPQDRMKDHAHLATVLSLAEALDLRDSGTARHSQTVGRYAQLMARELLPPERVERVRLAGILHDIGKIGVPDAILRKPMKLSAWEYEQMKKHPEIGGRILGGSGLDDIRAWIMAHHERPDGEGYPLGLPDEEIPLEAKILAVADAYEAMTSDRVYRRAMEESAARAELERHAGTQFDERVVSTFLSALDRGQGATGPVEHRHLPA